MILRGLGAGGGLIVRGISSFFAIIAEVLTGKYRKSTRRRRERDFPEYPERSKSAQKFIAEVKEKILETGVVKNVHKTYNPRTNKRYKVSKHQAEVIAWRIAQKKGMRAGKKPD